jgi:hypothetical protein
MAKDRTIAKEFESVAKQGIGKNWTDWTDAIEALATGLGHKPARFDVSVDATFHVVSVAGWWLPLTEFVWDNLGESFNSFLFRSGYIVDPTASEGAFDQDEYEDELSPIRLGIGDSYRVPFHRSIPDISATAFTEEDSINISSLVPLGYRGEATEFLVAISAQGIWRVARDGSFMYWSTWDEVLSVEVFEDVVIPAGGFGQDQYPQCALVTFPKKREQVIGFQIGWLKSSEIIQRILSVKKPQSGESSEEDATIIMNGLEDPNLLLGADRAEFFTINPSDAKRFQEAFRKYGHPPDDERKRVFSQWLEELVDLERFGLGGLMSEYLACGQSIRENFDCEECGGVADSLELISRIRQEWARFDNRLPEGITIQAISSEILTSEEPKKVKPALLQREFGLDYELAVEILEVSRLLGYGGPGICTKCLDRRAAPSKSIGSLTREGLSPSVRFAVLQRDGFRCRYCGMGAQSNPPVELEVDHVVPVAAGGSNELGNLVSACAPCNRGKSSRPVL